MTKGRPSWASQIGEILGELFQRLEASPGIFYNHLCERIRQLFEADLVWFGTVDAQGEVKPRAFSGKEAGYLRGLQINIRDPLLSQGPTGQALLKKNIMTESDILRSPRFAPWRQKALAYGFRSTTCLPLFFGKNPAGPSTFILLAPNIFPPGPSVNSPPIFRSWAVP
ncbi:GAF domain-containing protein [Thermosulfurimonas marina]|uniref:GAF domain-containing protein n=1 Tax=Thermosulfurimonas marina TaxID=2047767 RepID=A0A6H1WRR2_9BACT|nr:GAF domain-containing protein [Thermosulfurimonas marina]